MVEAIFQTQSIFKIPGQGIMVSGILKEGTLKLSMFTELGEEKLTILRITLNNQEVEEIKSTDPNANHLALTFTMDAEKLIPRLGNQELTFKEK